MIKFLVTVRTLGARKRYTVHASSSAAAAIQIAIKLGDLPFGITVLAA